MHGGEKVLAILLGGVIAGNYTVFLCFQRVPETVHGFACDPTGTESGLWTGYGGWGNFFKTGGICRL